MNKFLNRILGMHVDLQNALFQYFQDTHKYIILKAKREKHWDLGILGEYFVVVCFVLKEIKFDFLKFDWNLILRL